ncbi:2-amino-4-hydroxy-6-hydroxymethyldihydropteridine pyrophosphokinase [Paraglaciecola sp. T6c]|uniref:2-amino-4-hydroxy-6- hydroxymethyldihydropteridine diphosphokinase n=1 Tax=Pseudoalteromonas atlantica (strain T6c / ATCC BAA-1087) TaxID=3042615 RepID=UPI00005C518F|nr:2-amino-4-hydroxy-6-hydroxymethyldihydropteridine diphosphokinase [Paraglaciecola sp. T6c]ABG42434.1 2-amino-4-hydroxy-6-hydroxymethyldihydropteridine pyrophosphokinase [Paraglaciecola sp. T6c]
MSQVYVGLGSNLAQPQQQISQALRAIELLPASHISATSSLYISRPMGPQDQPSYVNAVVEVQTKMQAVEFLHCLQKIELEHGRVRKAERWGPRTLDLDILIFGTQIIDSVELTVPHYGMKEREFVLYPLHEIAPELQLPNGTKLTELLINCPLNGLEKLPYK